MPIPAVRNVIGFGGPEIKRARKLKVEFMTTFTLGRCGLAANHIGHDV